MASPWDGFSSRLWSDFDSGYSMGRERKKTKDAETRRVQDLDRASARRAEDLHLAERREMAADEERGFNRRKALGFEGSEDPAEVAFRERMAARQAVEDRHKNALAAYMEERYRGGPRAQAEQAVGEKLKALNAGIDDINTRGEEQGRRWYLPGFMEREELDKADIDLREQMRTRRAGLLGLSQAAPKGGGSWRDYVKR